MLFSTKWALLLSGVVAETSKRNVIFDYVLFNFNAILLHTVVLSEIAWFVEGIQLGKSLTDLAIVAPCSIVSLTFSVKSLSLYIERDKILEIEQAFEDLKENFDIDVTNASKIQQSVIKEQKAISKMTIKFMKLISNLFLSLVFASVISFSIMPILSMFIEYLQTGTHGWKLCFSAKFFFDPFVAPLFYFLYIHQVVATCVVGLNTYASESLFYYFCSSIQTYFRFLSVELEHVIESNHDKAVDKKLAEIIRKHSRLMQLTKIVESLYSKSTLFNFITSSLLICLITFTIVFCRVTETVLLFITLLITILSQIFLVCYFGDMMMRGSTELSTAVYKSRWYEGDQKSRKTLLIILIRAQKPCKLTAANLMDINLQAFTSILSRSWSLFAVLQRLF